MHILTKCGKIPGKYFKFSQRKIFEMCEREKKGNKYFIWINKDYDSSAVKMKNKARGKKIKVQKRSLKRKLRSLAEVMRFSFIVWEERNDWINSDYMNH